MTSAIKQIFKPVEQVLEVLGDFHTISAIAGAFQGKPVSNDAPAVAKGVSGIFGKKDEREMWRLIYEAYPNAFNKQENEDDIAILERFFKWQYAGQKDLQRSLQAIWMRNAFNKFVTDMVAGQPKKSETTNTVTTENKDGSKKATTDTKVEYQNEKPVDYLAIKFLNFMVEKIKRSNVEISKKYPRFKPETVERRSFKELTTFFASFGIPYMPPPGTENPIEWAISKSSPAAQSAVEFINNRHNSIEQRTAQAGWFTRFMLKL